MRMSAACCGGSFAMIRPVPPQAFCPVPMLCLRLLSHLVELSAGMFPGAASNAALLSSRRGAKVICGVDATRLHFWPRGLGLAQAAGGFDVIVFPFPHTGYVPENVYENNWAHIARNKQLVADFFESAVHQLKPGILVRLHASTSARWG